MPASPTPGTTYVTGHMALQLGGRACMSSTALQGDPSRHWTQTGWIHFQFQEDKHYQLAFQGLDGFIPFADIEDDFKQDGTPNPKDTYYSDLNNAFPGCGGTISEYKNLVNRSGSIANPQTALNDVFTSPDEWFGTSDGKTLFPMSRNQELPNVAPQEGMFFDSTSATSGGDFVRGILPMGTTFKELDYMTYPDPNGFCWNPNSTAPPAPDKIVDWVFGELEPSGTQQAMFGWIPYRDPNATSCP